MIHNILALPANLVAVLVLLAVILVFIILEVISLKIGISAVKGNETSFGNVFITGLILVFITILITGAFQFLLPSLTLLGTLAALIIDMFIIQSRHNTTFFGALGAIIIYAIVLVLLYFVLVYVFPSILTMITDLIGIPFP